MSQEFSVSMCVYGGDDPAFFDAALGSVVGQTVPPSEIVLTVDGPVPPDTEGVIGKYRARLAGSGTSFQVVRLEANMGHGEARRICFDHCNYDLIALMDADDLSVPDRFEKQLAVFAGDPSLSDQHGLHRREHLDGVHFCNDLADDREQAACHSVRGGYLLSPRQGDRFPNVSRSQFFCSGGD